MPRRLSVRICLAVAAIGAALLAGSAGAAGNPDSVRDVPIATTAVSREQIEQSGRAIDVLGVLSLMRSNPGGFADSLGNRSTLRGVVNDDWDEALLFLRDQDPLPAFRYSPALSDIALIHARNIGSAGLTSHTGTDGSTLGSRVRNRGMVATLTAEELSFGQTLPTNVVMQLIVDRGVPGKPHRRDLFNPVFTLAGVGCARHSKFGHVCVINLSNEFMVPPPPTSLPPSTPGFQFNCPAGTTPAELDQWRQDFMVGLNLPPHKPEPARQAPTFAGFSIANEIAYQAHTNDPAFAVKARLGIPRNLGLGFGYCSTDYIRNDDIDLE